MGAEGEMRLFWPRNPTVSTTSCLGGGGHWWRSWACGERFPIEGQASEGGAFFKNHCSGNFLRNTDVEFKKKTPPIIHLLLFTDFLTKPAAAPTTTITLAFISHQHHSHGDIMRPLGAVAGCCSSASSRSSQLSRSQSHMFDELEAIAPPSPSCPSVSSRSSSPDAGTHASRRCHFRCQIWIILS